MTKTEEMQFTGDLKRQHEYAEELKQKGDEAFDLVATEAFVRGMRDSGYKSTATAIFEFIDNSEQAESDNIDILCVEGGVPKVKGGAVPIHCLAVVDDGHGMEPDMMRAGVRWGGTHRENDREGLGRYGFGLPSAAVSMTEHYEVYSKLKGGDWYKLEINLHDIAAGKLTNEKGQVVAPNPIKAELPKFIQTFLKKQRRTLDSGTVINIVNPDRLSTGYRRLSSLKQKLMQNIGLVYRNTLKDKRITVNGDQIQAIDPLFLTPGCMYHDIGNGVQSNALPSVVFSAKGNNGRTGNIRMRFCVMDLNFTQVTDDGGNTKLHKPRFAVMTENHSFFIVTRAGRQIDLVTRTPLQRKPWSELKVLSANYDKYWGVEIDFDPILDELFGITVNKQQVSISDDLWEIFENENLPALISSARRQSNKLRKKQEGDDTKPSPESKRASEQIMQEAEKFQSTKRIKAIQDKAEATQPKIEIDAKKIAEEQKRPVADVVREILDETESKRYIVDFEFVEGAPFYRPELYGAQIRIWINKAHQFYSDIYNGPGSNPRLKTAIELLLMVLGVSENQAIGEKEMFYARERAEWSTELSSLLTLLDKTAPLIDAVEDQDDQSVEHNADSNSEVA